MGAPKAKRVGTLVTLCAVLCACKPAHPSIRAGQVTLSYIDASNNSATFLLDNQSTRPIYFRGRHNFWSASTAVYAMIACIVPGSAILSDAPFPLPEFVGGPPPVIKVAPGELIKLKVVGEYGELIQKSKGRLCQVRLPLEPMKLDNAIESTLFAP